MKKDLYDLEYGYEISKKWPEPSRENAPEMRSTYILYAKRVVRLRRIDVRCRIEAAAFPELVCHHKILL